ncbi:uncharacterized protein [Nicotiana tomentosiformis]|uniref:uncharacterized protein n=1 Tax=Nicotiana tomentosiformis TaxID=4098 RepID=UPI00388CA428
MQIALQTKRKLEFVTGTCKKNIFKKELHEEWEICNAIILSWIMITVSMNLVSGIVYASDTHLVWEDLKERFDKVSQVRIFELHKKIVSITQGTDSIDTYFTRLMQLLSECDSLVPTPGCDCVKSKDYIEHLHHQRFIQLINGLNKTYGQARRQILMKTVEPTLNQAYALIIEDESQRSSLYPVLATRRDPISMQDGRGQCYKGKKTFMKCDYCKMSKHLKENCYKLVSYPMIFNGKRKVVVNCANGTSEHEEPPSMDGGKSNSDDPAGEHFFTEDHYK